MLLDFYALHRLLLPTQYIAFSETELYKWGIILSQVLGTTEVITLQ